jgi:hypothetical protein
MIWIVLAVLVVGYFIIRAININTKSHNEPRNEYDSYADYENRKQNEKLDEVRKKLHAEWLEKQKHKAKQIK